MGNSSNGHSISTGIALYMVVKSVVNLLLGFSLTNIVMIVVNAALGYTLRRGRKPFNLLTAVFLGAIALMHLKANIEGRQALYLAEGIADILCAAMLVINKDVRAFFS
ncbi:hypothetical protein SAMN02910447_01047 [Ruminococcus sp. YE71]|uniref:hypothetical protein n=1 Tax=unclassified Ruminococcus TaxID=2608920 RepID=UPI0008911FAB|nr:MULTISPECIES: hypothetical protein [unclassified Ruminococcus]SDA16000.1 hypothetical protein SAMN02910446_01046 [Ruminococcus sp. YE78]SFW23680.1 hypothetical protein SAMN02910447_01047 [Ruminococcus sp. YE71]